MSLKAEAVAVAVYLHSAWVLNVFVIRSSGNREKKVHAASGAAIARAKCAGVEANLAVSLEEARL